MTLLTIHDHVDMDAASVDVVLSHTGNSTENHRVELPQICDQRIDISYYFPAVKIRIKIPMMSTIMPLPAVS